jgi:dTDP-4-amino-4,6-dideoxygalactose transaminase
MTSGEGGAVIMNDDALGEHVWGLSGEAGRQFGEVFSGQRQNVGWNSRMTEMQAAILLVQLSRLDEQKAVRQANARYLSSRLSEVAGISPLPDAPDQNYYSYIFKYDPCGFKGLPKARFMEALTAEGIELFSSPSHQPPAYRSPKFYSSRRDYSDVYCPVAEKVFNEEAVGLRATWTLLGPRADMDDIADAVLKVQEHVDELLERPD